MLLMTFAFSHLEIGPHFPLSAISHLGRVNSCPHYVSAYSPPKSSQSQSQPLQIICQGAHVH